MPTDTQQAVDELLAELTAAFEPETREEPDRDRLDELANRADDLVASTDLPALAAATGLGSEDDPPSSLPEAIGSGDPEDVAALRSVLTLSKLAAADAEQADELSSELASLVETAQWEPAAEVAPSDTDRNGDAAASEHVEPEDEESTPLQDRLRSQLEETKGVFDQIPDLEGLADEFGGDDSEEAAEQSESVETNAREDEQPARSRDGTRWRPGGEMRGTTHSTIPTTGRQDIGRRPGRFSSVRGSTVSKR